MKEPAEIEHMRILTDYASKLTSFSRIKSRLMTHQKEPAERWCGLEHCWWAHSHIRDETFGDQRVQSRLHWGLKATLNEIWSSSNRIWGRRRGYNVLILTCWCDDLCLWCSNEGIPTLIIVVWRADEVINLNDSIGPFVEPNTIICRLAIVCRHWWN